MPLLDRIEINPKIMLGKPVVRGTRITVELILRKLSEGAKEEEPLAAYPHLKPEDIRAALAYAAGALAGEEMIFYQDGSSRFQGTGDALSIVFKKNILDRNQTEVSRAAVSWV
jgi:uncharacterized protein (DUF433 family)